MKIRYEVAGMMELHPEFTAGRTRIRIAFRGGHLSNGAITPASFETSDPVLQKVIEASHLYRSGRIRIGKRYGECGNISECTALTPITPPSRMLKADSIEDAADKLHFDYDVPLEHLCNEEAVKEMAGKLGLQLIIEKDRM